MPMATPEAQREYQRKWILRRRADWVTENGPCAQCGSTEDLEVDHKDAATKSLPLSKVWSMAYTNPVRIAELAKCQVLCGKCHKAKTKVDQASKISGTKAVNAVLTETELNIVRARLQNGDRGAAIASDLNVSKYVISRIKRGITYRPIPA
jgi:hypothetical protein